MISKITCILLIISKSKFCEDYHITVISYFSLFILQWYTLSHLEHIDKSYISKCLAHFRNIWNDNYLTIKIYILSIIIIL